MLDVSILQDRPRKCGGPKQKGAMAKSKLNKGKPTVNATEEQKILLSRQICDLYASQNATIASCCEAVGVQERTFRLWVQKNAEVSEMYKNAKEKANIILWDRIREKATRALEKLIEGQTYTETRRETGTSGPNIIDKTVKSEVFVTPNPTAVIFALKGEFPERFAERTKTDITSGGEPLNGNAAPATPEQLAELKRIFAATPDAKTDNGKIPDTSRK